jgi:hypothetical protein
MLLLQPAAATALQVLLLLWRHQVRQCCQTHAGQLAQLFLQCMQQGLHLSLRVCC